MADKITPVERRYQRLLSNELKHTKNLPHGNDRLLLEFVENYRYKKKKPSLARKNRFLCIMRHIATILNAPLKPFGKKEILKAMCELDKKDYSLNTFKEYAKDIKVWIKWINPKGYHAVLDDEEVKKTLEVGSPYGKEWKTKVKKELLTDEEFLKLLAAGNKQDKALLACLFGLGARPGELTNVQRDMVVFAEDGCVLVGLEGKTGTRTVKLRADLAHYVREWFEASPRKEKDAPLFVDNKNKALSYNTLQFILKKLAVKTGLGKWEYKKSKKGKQYKVYSGRPLRPYTFRRTHATWVLKNMGDKTAKLRMWGNDATNMVKVYSGLVDADANEDYDRATGNGKKEKQKKLENRCWRCGKLWPLNQTFCPDCNSEISGSIIEGKTSRLLESLLSQELDAILEKKLDTLLQNKSLKVRKT